MRINRSTSKPPAAYYDSHSLVDVSSELRGAADSLEAVMVALSAAEQSEETNAFDTFFAGQLGEQRVGAKELLDSAMDAMDQTLDTLNAIRTKLPAQSMGGASPALARAFDGAASPVRAAAAPAAAAAAGRTPLVSMNLSKRTPPMATRSSPAGVSVVWSFGSDAKAAAYQSPLRSPAATSRPTQSAASARMRSTPSAMSPAAAAAYRSVMASPRASAYSSPIRSLSSAAGGTPRSMAHLSGASSPFQPQLVDETLSHKRVALQNLMRSSSSSGQQAATPGLTLSGTTADMAPTATVALASGVAAETVADVVSRQISSVDSPGVPSSLLSRLHHAYHFSPCVFLFQRGGSGHGYSRALCRREQDGLHLPIPKDEDQSDADRALARGIRGAIDLGSLAVPERCAARASEDSAMTALRWSGWSYFVNRGASLYSTYTHPKHLQPQTACSRTPAWTDRTSHVCRSLGRAGRVSTETGTARRHLRHCYDRVPTHRGAALPLRLQLRPPAGLVNRRLQGVDDLVHLLLAVDESVSVHARVHHLLRGLTLVLGDLHLEEASDIRSGEQVDLNLSRANPCSPRETERFGRRCVRACCIACGCDI